MSDTGMNAYLRLMAAADRLRVAAVEYAHEPTRQMWGALFSAAEAFVRAKEDDARESTGRRAPPTHTG